MQKFKRIIFEYNRPEEPEALTPGMSSHDMVLLKVGKDVQHFAIHSMIITPKFKYPGTLIDIKLYIMPKDNEWSTLVLERAIDKTTNVVANMTPSYLEPGDTLILAGTEHLDRATGWLSYTETIRDEE